MQHDIVWKTLYTTAVEHLRLTLHGDGHMAASGMVVGLVENQPFRLAYEVGMDAQCSRSGSAGRSRGG